MRIILLFFILLMNVFAFGAPSPIPSPTPVLAPVPAVDVGSVISQIFADVAQGKWVALVACVVLLIMYLFRVYVLPKLSLGNGILPHLSVALGLLIGWLLNFIGGVPAAEASRIALFSGGGAALLWDGIFKLISKKS